MGIEKAAPTQDACNCNQTCSLPDEVNSPSHNPKPSATGNERRSFPKRQDKLQSRRKASCRLRRADQLSETESSHPVGFQRTTSNQATRLKTHAELRFEASIDTTHGCGMAPESQALQESDWSHVQICYRKALRVATRRRLADSSLTCRKTFLEGVQLQVEASLSPQHVDTLRGI